jgi:hypothetical protein
MATNIKMKEFLKENILNTIARKYKYSPDRSIEYLKEINRQLIEVQSLIKETKDYMYTVKEIKEKEIQKNIINYSKETNELSK